MHFGRRPEQCRTIRRYWLSCVTPPSLAIAMATAVFALSACSPTVANHGYSLDQESIAKIEPSRSSRQQVLQLLGSPSLLSTFDDDAWYYVSQRTEKISFYQEGVVEQDVITVLFNDQNIVEAVDRYGLEQTAAIVPVDRVTPTAGASPSVLKQFIGNIGRFSNSNDSYDPDG